MKNNPIILALILLLVYGCASVSITGRKQLMLVSDEEVLGLSKQSFNSYMKKAKISTNAANNKTVSEVGRRIAHAVETFLRQNGKEADIKNFHWEFHLVQDPSANAFCMPGGKIVVNAGLLKIAETPDELAVVLGHEIAHAVAKHSAERISQQIVAEYGGQILGAIMQEQSNTAKVLAQQVYGLGAQVGVMLPYSRINEYEADHLGLIFAAMAGYDPGVAIEFWKKMAASGGGEGWEFASTHPSNANRIAKLKEIMPKALKYKKKTGAFRYERQF